MALYCSIDLRSNNHLIAVISEESRRIFERRLGNDLSLTLSALEPYRSELERALRERHEFQWNLPPTGKNVAPWRIIAWEI